MFPSFCKYRAILYSSVVGLLDLTVHLTMGQNILRDVVFVQKANSLAPIIFQHALKNVYQVV